VAALASLTLLTVVPLAAQAQPGVFFFDGPAPPVGLGRPLWVAPGVDDYLAGQNRFFFPVRPPSLGPVPPWVNQPPLWPAPGVDDYLAGRNDFVFPQGPFQSPSPLLMPNGLSRFEAFRALRGR